MTWLLLLAHVSASASPPSRLLTQHEQSEALWALGDAMEISPQDIDPKQSFVVPGLIPNSNAAEVVSLKRGLAVLDRRPAGDGGFPLKALIAIAGFPHPSKDGPIEAITFEDVDGDGLIDVVALYSSKEWATDGSGDYRQWPRLIVLRQISPAVFAQWPDPKEPEDGAAYQCLDRVRLNWKIASDAKRIRPCFSGSRATPDAG